MYRPVHLPNVQEMVNLLLTGHAVSNVFDGNVSLDSGATSKVIYLHLYTLLVST